jgi:hypothetical protein
MHPLVRLELRHHVVAGVVVVTAAVAALVAHAAALVLSVPDQSLIRRSLVFVA